RISWSNRPPVSAVMDTDADGKIVTATDPGERAKLTVMSAETRRTEMKNVCKHCHTPDYINAFYSQYDDFVVLYNEKFAKPGQAIMKALGEQELITKTQFDEEIEWTWFYLWHHEGRRARHGASMMAPDYAHWHGMYEVAERFYMQLIPQARELIEHAKASGQPEKAAAVEAVVEEIMSRPEHKWGPGLKPKTDTPSAEPASAAAAAAAPSADITAAAGTTTPSSPADASGASADDSRESAGESEPESETKPGEPKDSPPNS
ncbi:MAG: hypothetical protein KDA96_06040, partial [Planctomycetaceae bacterium]|nr:hypothetical protein [Planctomycetaceae bacterium]